MRSIILTIAMLSLLAGCTPMPSAIQPNYVSQSKYAGLDCTELNKERLAIDNALAEAEDKQGKAVAGEVVTSVLFGVIGFAASKMMTSANPENVANLKGETVAINKEMERC